MTDIGNSLREARIRKGLSIKDVEDATKIRSKYLEALEEDDFEVLPGSTYVKAFLRTYATFLKLDADALVEEYRGSYESKGEEPINVRSDFSRERRSPTSVERKRKRTRQKQRGYALVAAVAVVIVVLLAWFGSGRGQDAASIEAGNISSPTSSVSIAAVSSTTVSTDADAAATTSTQTSTSTGGSLPTGGDVVLTVSVTEGSCWLLIREDGETGAELFAGTLSAGSQETFEGSKRYWMTVGKPEVLAVSINGAPYTLEEPAGSFVVTEAGVERTE